MPRRGRHAGVVSDGAIGTSEDVASSSVGQYSAFFECSLTPGKAS